VPEIVEGPVNQRSYEFDPAPFGTFTIPDDVARFRAEDIVVLHKEEDHRKPPYQVSLVDGRVVFFRPSEKSEKLVDSDVETNPSHREIAFYLHLHQLQPPLAPEVRIPKLLGVVISRADDDPSGREQLAGILLEWIDGEPLIDSEAAIMARDKHTLWKDQVNHMVAALQERGIFSFGLSPFGILIDRQDNSAWLTSFASYELGNNPDDNLIPWHPMDSNHGGGFQRIQLIFDRWLPDPYKADSDTLGVQAKRENRLQRYFDLVDSANT